MINVAAVTVAAAGVQNHDRRILDSAVLGFAVVGLDPDVVWIDIAKVDVAADL